jgi:hypothetical protein
MKIKTLAIAAATLAVGAITSQAQVYSQNIVGYVNSTAVANQYVMWCNPLTTGNDVLTNVFQGLPGGTQLSKWNGTGWTTYTYNVIKHHWLLGTATNDNVLLPPGTGYFLYNATTPFTNTFSGTIVANTGGGTATNSLTTGYIPVGALVPYGDVVTNGSTFNLTVGGGSVLQVWDVPLQKYDPYTYNGVKHQWLVGTATNNPTVAVGQGFFISPNVATNWVQTLQ